MKHHISADDLIRYIYKEVSFLEKMAINKAIHQNLNLREQYQNLLEAHQNLNETLLDNPNANVLDNILYYSRLSNLQTEFSA
jgi:hypothetical protein